MKKKFNVFNAKSLSQRVLNALDTNFTINKVTLEDRNYLKERMDFWKQETDLFGIPLTMDVIKFRARIDTIEKIMKQLERENKGKKQ